MKIKDGVIVFESTGSTMKTFGASGISLSDKGELRIGYDCSLEKVNDEGDEIPLSDEEKKELAEHMIEQWKQWAGI